MWLKMLHYNDFYLEEILPYHLKMSVVFRKMLEGEHIMSM